MFRLLRIAAAAFGLFLAAASPAPAGFSDRPGDFDYYVLALSWSPTYCLGGDGSRQDDPQCSAKRPYGFVVHGLWPQYEKGWPESCNINGSPRVPSDLRQSMLDIMPSERLISHEYQKHGTCSGLSAKGYFDLTRRLYQSVKVPPKYAGLTRELQVTIPELKRDLLAANPQLRPDMLFIDCERGGRLREVRICFSIDGKPASCGRNEVQDRMCRASPVSMPPVRGGGAFGGQSDTGGEKKKKKGWFNGLFNN